MTLILADDQDPAVGFAHLLLSCLPVWDKLDEAHKGETPRRFVKALREMTEPEEFTFTTFPTNDHNMITLGPIPFYTLCAHHVVPFYGKVYISYVPDGKLAGLSKFARAVKQVAKGLWVQEDLTEAIATFLEDQLTPQGVGIVIRAEHLCMAMRGVAQPGVTTTTATMRGVYADHSRTAKTEFLNWVTNSHV